MVSALDRKLFRDLRHLMGQIITIALVVACGIAAYVCMRTTWVSLAETRTAYYERYRFPDVFAALKHAPNTLAKRIERIPGVARVQTRIVESITIPIEGMAEPATGRIVSLPGERAPMLGDLYLRSGRRPSSGRAGEAVVIETFAEAHGLTTGSRLPVVIGGTLRSIEIVGIALSPEYMFAMGPNDIAADERRFAVLWMDRQVVAPAFRMEGAFNDVTLTLQPDASEKEVLRRLDDVLTPYGGLGAIGRDKQLSNYILNGELSQLEAFATVVPVIFLAVAALLLNIVLSRLVYVQRSQIAALKALGYSNRRIGLHYLELVSVMVALGAVLGAGLGAWLGNGLLGIYGGFFHFPILIYRFEPQVLIVGIGISLVAAVLGALTSVWRIARMPPAEAMRPPAPLNYRTSLLERMGLAHILGTSAMMVLRELRRRPLRLLLSSLGIAAALGIMITGRFGYDSFEHLMSDILHREQGGDMAVTFLEPMPERAVRELVHIPGVLDAEGTRILPVRFRAGPRFRDSSILGLSREPRLRKIIDRNSREVLPPLEGLAISRKLAEILDVGLGQSVQVEVREGRRPTLQLPISALVDDSFGLQGYMSQQTLSQALGELPAVNSVQLRVDTGADRRVRLRLKELPKVIGVVHKQSLIDRFYAQTGESMWWMTIILTGFAGTIAVGVVYNNARVALSLRSRDLASLRILGFTRGEISAVLLGELGAQLILAIPIGLVLGTWWSHAIMSTVDPEVYRMPIVIASHTYAFAAAVTAAAGMCSALLVRRKLDRLDLIAVLKTRE